MKLEELQEYIKEHFYTESGKLNSNISKVNTKPYKVHKIYVDKIYELTNFLTNNISFKDRITYILEKRLTKEQCLALYDDSKIFNGNIIDFIKHITNNDGSINKGYTQTKSKFYKLNKHNFDKILERTSFMKSTAKWNQRCDAILNNMIEYPKCKNEGCDNFCTNWSRLKGYSETCSIKCSANSRIHNNRKEIKHKLKAKGFQNNIPASIISHPCNLQMIPYKENLSKSSNCSHTLDELMKKIEEFENNTR